MRWCCCCRSKENSFDEEQFEPKKPLPIWLRILKWTIIVLVVLLILGVIFIWVVCPLIFMGSVEIQRKLMFPNFDQPENPQYFNYALYGAVGVRNFYVSVKDSLGSGDVSLGVWQVVPEDTIEASNGPNFSFEKALENSSKPIIIYFHGNSGTRIYPYDTYKVLRKYFHVLAFDYRSYGDSTEALLTEKAVVADAVQLYEYFVQIVAKSKQPIYIWGHSLGTALSTHTVKSIFEDPTITQKPKGLILEAPFNTMREEIPHHPIGKLFAWLPWFEATILDPLEENDFHFKSTTNIKSVNCSIMIISAEDDSIIPWTLGEDLSHTAENAGKDVYFHLISSVTKSDHLGAWKWPPLPEKIGEFIEAAGKKRN